MSETPLPAPATGPDNAQPAPVTGEQIAATAAATNPNADPEAPHKSFFSRIVNGGGLVSVLAIVASLIFGAILIILTDPDVAAASSYFFAQPGDTLTAAWKAVSSAYGALFESSIFNSKGRNFGDMIYPLTETLTVATPLILAGLGVMMAFRAGMFNIGAQGQIVIGAALAAYVGFSWNLPVGLHLVVVILAGILGGGLWAGIAGFLKARTGAHEVIVTIMLNYIALNLVAYFLTLPSWLRPGSNNPISPIVPESAQLPLILGDNFRLHLGFIIALAAVVFCWWLLNRSTVGFEMRAVGANPAAARTAGMNVSKGYIVAMVVAGALAGLAGVAQISGTEHALTVGIAATFGFDAITVALLGRSKPLGTLFAGLLFGALRAGGVGMQTETGVPIDIVLVVQSFIVLFIAAPPLVRAMFGLNAGAKRAKKRAAQAAAGGAA